MFVDRAVSNKRPTSILVDEYVCLLILCSLWMQALSFINTRELSKHTRLRARLYGCHNWNCTPPILSDVCVWGVSAVLVRISDGPIIRRARLIHLPFRASSCCCCFCCPLPLHTSLIYALALTNWSPLYARGRCLSVFQAVCLVVFRVYLVLTGVRVCSSVHTHVISNYPNAPPPPPRKPCAPDNWWA